MKPDSRRPLVNRSRWPTTRIDGLTSRCLDWVSSAFIPAHLHIDICRTDLSLKSVAHFSSHPCRGVVHAVGGDVESCFTNITHQLVTQSWSFYHACLRNRVPGISAPRARSGKAAPFIYPRGSRGNLISFKLGDIEAVIHHHLRTSWFVVGILVGKQIEGIPMGSALGTALARMVLIFLDVVFYSFQRPPEIFPEHRVQCLSVLGADIVLLELRYMDDVIGFWKGPPGLSESDCRGISDWLWERLCHRYPLPLERDNSGVFVGLAFELTTAGQISVRPATLASASYGSLGHSPLMPFCSFVPRSMKRSLVLGIAARVDSFTFPLELKPLVLASALKQLERCGGFPDTLLRRWITSWRHDSLPWVQNTWLYF